MEDKNKTYSDGWDPTEYEIYTKEETEKRKCGNSFKHRRG